MFYIAIDSMFTNDNIKDIIFINLPTFEYYYYENTIYYIYVKVLIAVIIVHLYDKK